MTTYLLVHGAWHGGWCWDRVAAPLREHGHRVFTPDLTMDAAAGLHTHAAEVAALLVDEDLRDVVLVGHSYSGFVVREAADRVPERVARIALVDAWFGRDGESMDSRAPEWFTQWVDSLTTGHLIGVPPAATVGVTDPVDVKWLEANLVPHPRRSFAEPTTLSGAVERIPCRAVVCLPGERLPFAGWAAERGWPVTGLRSGHDCMITAPDALARILQSTVD
ncbi:alpha/beta fold hydrolase [Amycolatopsis thermophila]|uniref:Pimeloyl-ACP methyl ester carboxylesterase n=1 Tax=Amycolatopsis thermophila TaxID=206084 RepID=A0ABU0EW09_9PSEU|nr:alpha/beta hydrolase [Amycolatopsis thermophila]MDQ0379453.1 pimeloyl-ACP methyl ester carboxylesterase [Amycolatopsis thermophila]